MEGTQSNLVMHQIDHRPWGKYEILLDADNVKVKRITVDPGGKLSYQYHHKRSETWILIEGTGHFTLNDNVQICTVGDVLQIPQGAKHRIENTGEQPIIFIEVQRGTYFGEDDIVRIEDSYGRAN